MNKFSPIGIFDSGIGGLTVLEECKKILPHEDFIYLADSKFAPYGGKSDKEILDRVFACVKVLTDNDCKCVVVACNTATNVGISTLRNSADCKVIGVEPALKPAFMQCQNKNILLLCTEATSRQQKLHDLIKNLGAKNIIISPQKNLAALIESSIDDLDSLIPQISQILLPYMNIGAVVLGCTHYVFIKHLVDEFYGGKVKIFDGNEGTARRLKEQLEAVNLLSENTKTGDIKFLST